VFDTLQTFQLSNVLHIFCKTSTPLSLCHHWQTCGW